MFAKRKKIMSKADEGIKEEKLLVKNRRL